MASIMRVSLIQTSWRSFITNVGGTMKTIASLAIALFLVTGCERGQSTRAASEERTDATEAMEQQRDDYIKTMNAKLDEFDQKLDGLDERAAALKGQVRDEFKANIDRLRDERRAVGEKLADIDNVNVESWTTMKQDVDSAFASLENSYQQVSAMHNPVPATTDATPTR
jgi:hypothetical protein